MNRWTQLVQFDPCPGDPFKANSTPLYQTATFAQESLDVMGQYDYTRSGNPTRTVVEQQIARLEEGKFAFVFNSGMAALTTVVGLLNQGDHIIVGDDVYGGTHRLLSQRLPQRGISVTWVDTTDLAAVALALTDHTRWVLIETPSNPLQKITDIKALATLLHKKNVLLAVDNTFLSPWLQQPLLLGADLVIHSATKHLGGHGDVTAGAIITNHGALAEIIAFIQNAEGSALSPFESWLLLRGLKTLGLRVERQQQVAGSVVDFLKQHAAVKKIYYPGLPQHPGFNLHRQQAKGPGMVITFETGSREMSKVIAESTQLFTLSVSFGSLSSLISLPCNMSHAAIPDEARRLPPDLVRLSIGIEAANDLIADLGQAFAKALGNDGHQNLNLINRRA